MGHRRLWLVVVALVVVLVVAGLATLPLAVRHLAIQRLEDMTGRRTDIADVDLNPFTRRLTLKNLVVHSPDGAPPLVELPRVDARYRLLPLLRGRIHLESLALSRPAVHLVRGAGGQLSAEDVAEHWLARPGGGALPAVERLTIEGGELTFLDRVPEPERRWTVGRFSLEARDIGVVSDAAAGRASASFEIGNARGRLELSDVAVRPLRARAVLGLDGLDLAPFGAYVDADAAYRPAAGRLSVRASVDYDARGVVRADVGGTLHGLALAARGARTATVEAPTITFSARDVAYVGGASSIGHATVSAPRASVLAARIPERRLDVTGIELVFAGSPVPASGRGRLTLAADLPDGGRLEARGPADLLAPAATLTVDVTDLDVGLARLWMPPDAPVTPARGKAGATFALHYAPGDPLSLSGHARIASLEIATPGQRAPLVQDDAVEIAARDVRADATGVSIGTVEVVTSPTIVDARHGSTGRLHVPRLQLTATGGRFPGGDPTRVTVFASLPRGGRLQADGTWHVGAPQASFDVTVTDADLTLARAYLPADAPVTVESGHLDARVDVAWRGTVAADGRFALRGFTLARRGQTEPLIEHGRLDGTFSRLVAGDGHLSLARVRLAGTPTIVDATASPPQRFETRELSLTVTGLAWPGSRPARLEGHAEVADGGRADLTGTFEPGTLSADVRVVFANVDVTRAGGYLGPAVPLAIDGGRAGATVTLHRGRATGVRIDARGRIDGLDLRLTGAPGLRLRDDRISFAADSVVVGDGGIRMGSASIESSPELSRGDRVAVHSPRVTATLTGLASAGPDPASVAITAEFPDAGRLEVRGTFTAATRALDMAIRARDVPLDAVAIALPLDVPVAGRVDGHLTATVRAGGGAALEARGDVTLRAVTLGGGRLPPIRIDRIAADGLQVSEGALRVTRLAVVQPSIRIEREPDGSFPLRAMLTSASAGPAAPREETAARPSPSRDGEAFRFGVDRLVVEEGAVRFVDRTTTPFYSEEVTHLAMTLRGLTNAGGRRADVTVQGIVGADAAVDLHGEVAPFGEPFFLDMGGELRNFAVPRTNPYLRRFLDWIARSGQLTTQVHYRIVGDQLSATNELRVQRLAVEPAAGDQRRAERLVGLPLGLVVSLLKDARGEIHFTLPLSGDIDSPQFSFGDAIKQALKNVVGRLVTAPLRAIGSIFRRNGEVSAVKVDPLTFEPGSAAITPDAAEHLQRVADFLRASPYMRLALEPVVAEDDLSALRAREVTARIQRVQREDGLDLAAAARRVWDRAVPGAEPPPAVEGIVRTLAFRERVPADALGSLAERRMQAVRRHLVEQAGIQADRLLERPATPPRRAAGEGRLEFELVPS